MGDLTASPSIHTSVISCLCHRAYNASIPNLRLAPMLVERLTFQAKYGHGDTLVALFEEWIAGPGAMIGDHGASVIADAWVDDRRGQGQRRSSPDSAGGGKGRNRSRRGGPHGGSAGGAHGRSASFPASRDRVKGFPMLRERA